MTKSFLVELSRKVDIFRPLLLTALLCVGYESAEGVLDQTPTNTTVSVNHSAFFNCSKFNNISDELTWYHHTVDGKAKGVYEAGSIRGTYRGRFDMEKNLTSGAFNLLVQRPEPTDAGRYECVEDPLKKDTGASAELTVLDSNLVCKSDKERNDIVGPTECANPIAPDELQLLCSVTYSGNIPPQMEWRKDGSELLSNETKCDVRDNRVMCNATLEASLNMYGSAYICQIITAEQYNCFLKVSKIIYTFPDTSVTNITTSEEAFCSANTSKDLPCFYKWYKDNNTEHIKSDQTLKPSNPGLYRCEAECKIRNEICAFTAMVINASESETSNAGLITGLVVGSIIVGIITTIAIITIWRRYKKKKKKKQPRAVDRTTTGLLQDTTETDGKNKNTPLQNMNTIGCRIQQEDENDSGYDIQQAFDKAAYIGKGLGGYIHGPGLYKDKQCAFEEIKVSTADQTREEVMAKGRKICSRGQEWKAIEHKNLMSIFKVIFLCKANLESAAVFIIMDYAAGGSVRKALQRCTADLHIEVVKNWATQIAHGMNYLHDKGVVHKGINSAQILIMESPEGTDISNKTLKISQFRLTDEDPMSTQAMEKFSFAAPEVFDGTFVKEGDVWSYGVTVWEILTRGIPYSENTAGEVMKGISGGTLSLTIPTGCPQDLRDIFKECFDLEPKRRPAFSEILTRLR